MNDSRLYSNRQRCGVLLDYGGTLVEEVGFHARAGNEWLLARATFLPPNVTLAHVLERAERVTKEVADRRDQFQLETPWPALTRLIHDYFGIRFAEPMEDLEMAFWQAAVATAPMPGAREALAEFNRHGIPMAVLSNTLFRPEVIRYELDKHGLAEHLAFVMASSEYAVRKPNVLLFETAARRLGVEAEDIWFIGDRLDTDVAGAKAAGMRTIWFRPPENARPNCADQMAMNWADVSRIIHAAAGASCSNRSPRVR